MPEEEQSEPGILRILFDRGLLDEFERMCERNDRTKMTQELVNRIHQREKELMDWWKKTTGFLPYEKMVYHFKVKKLAVNTDGKSRSARNGGKIEALHKALMRTKIQKKKFLLEYNLIIRRLVDEVNGLQDDGGERE